jgi:hypothetical protein
MFMGIVLTPSVIAKGPPLIPYWGTEGNVVAPDAVLGTTNSVDLRIITDGAQKMVVTTSGNVGIGIATPAEKLDVDGNVHASGNFIAGSSTTYGDGYIGLSPGLDLDIDSGTLYIDSANDRVGIGTTSPTQELHVDGNIRITGAIYDSNNQAGSSGQILQSTGSGIEWTDSSSGSSGIKQLLQDFVVAQGKSVTAGDVVSFYDGEVQKWKKGFWFGSEHVFNSDVTTYPSASALSSTKFVLAYIDGDVLTGSAIIGDVSGDTITYGPEYVFNSYWTREVSVTALSSSKFVVAYSAGDEGRAYACDVSGNTITYASYNKFNSWDTRDVSAYALSSSKFVVAYRDNGNSGYGTAIIGDVSTIPITFGSEYVFNSASTHSISASALSSTKIVVAYTDSGNSFYGTAIIGDVSGNTITFGSEHVFNSASTGWISVSAHSATKFMVAYMDGDNSNYGTAIIGDVSGNSITFGSEHVFNSASTGWISASALSSSRFVVAYRDTSNSDYGTAIIGDVSGNTITFGSEHVFNSYDTWDVSAYALSSSKFVFAYTDEGPSYYGSAIIGNVQEGAPEGSQIVGIAKESKTDGQTVSVIIDGVSGVHSGLVQGEIYYLEEEGYLTLVETDYKIGLAISSTELLLADPFF